MSDQPSAGAPATPAAGTSGASAASSPWHAGLTPEDLGRLQTLGWDKLDAAEAAKAAFGHFLTAQTTLAAPADELLRLRKDRADPAYATDLAALWARLGKPEAAGGYDFSTLATADKPLDEKFVAFMRDAAFAADLPASAAAKMADGFLKYQASEALARGQAEQATAVQEAQALEANWGVNREVNEFFAKKGAEGFGLDATAIETLAKQLGGAKLMEAFRQMGVAKGEGRFIPNLPGANQAGEMTYEMAMARRGEFMTDRAWYERFERGDADAVREFNHVNRTIAQGNVTQRGQR